MRSDKPMTPPADGGARAILITRLREALEEGCGHHAVIAEAIEALSSAPAAIPAASGWEKRIPYPHEVKEFIAYRNGVFAVA